MNELARYRNSSPANLKGFGREWAAFDQSDLSEAEYAFLFDRYFSDFPFDELASDAEGFDVGCGSGRWAQGVASRVGKLHCIEASDEALDVARRRLASFGNVEFHLASIEHLPLADGSQDFGYSLGVLHHIPDAAQGLAECIRKLKPGAPFLVYVYYNLEGRAAWFRGLFMLSEVGRRSISRLPFPARKALAEVIAASVYWPLARLSRLLNSAGVEVARMPLNFYRDSSFYTMRTDALNRFGTAFVKRYSSDQLRTMMRAAGLTEISIREGLPKWVAIGRKAAAPKPTAPGVEEAAPRLRVTHVIGDLAAGGAEAILYRLVHEVRDVDHHVISLKGRDWYSDRIEACGGTVTHLGLTSPLSAAVHSRRLVKAIRESAPDVVQTWMYNSNLVGGLAARASGYPVVWGIHHSTIDNLPLKRRAIARLTGPLAKRVPAYIVNCSFASARNHAAIGYDDAPGEVISNGYDPAVYIPDDDARLRTRRGLGIADDIFVIGSISRWNVLKAIPDLIQAVDLLTDRGIALRCLLVGTGLDLVHGEFARALGRSRSATSLIPLGRRSDIPDLARAMDVHVLSSLTEACPNVVAETMLSGTPNVATDVGDAGRLVGETGWLVPPGHPEQIAAAIEQAYHEWRDRNADWQQRRLLARARTVENFSLEAMTRGYARVWAKVAGREA